jgi:hypothetical protein
MKNANKHLYLTSLLFLPLWYVIEQCNSSFFALINLIHFKGFFSVTYDVISFSIISITSAFVFHLFIKHISTKVSLSIGGLCLLSVYYFVCSPRLFLDNSSLFIFSSIFFFCKDNHPRLLFFSLCYSILLLAFSKLLLYYNYYGFTNAIAFTTLSLLISLSITANKKVYPSKVTLISLFLVILLPVWNNSPHPLTLTIELVLSCLLVNLIVYSLLNKHRRGFMIASIICSISYSALFVIAPLLTSIYCLIPAMHLFKIYINNRSKESLKKNTPMNAPKVALPSLQFYHKYTHL